MATKEKWIELIKDFYEKDVPTVLPREVEIPLQLPLNRAVTIIGPRRAGKTYVMYHTIVKLLKTVPKEQVLYVNLEQSGLGVLASGDLDVMLECLYEVYPQNKKKRVYLFLDEIQNVKEWEKFVRSSLDEGIKVYLSGSSSKMLSREIATSMRGRTLTYKVLPFSFREFLQAKGILFSAQLSSSEKAQIIHAFNDYVTYGGYPETVIYPQEKEKILGEILDVTIYKDVIERANVRNVTALRMLIDSLITSQEFSMHKFYNYLKSMGIKAGKNVLYLYSEHLTDAFFSFMLKKFSYSYKKSEQSIPKPYIIDNGFFSIKNMADKSRLMENMVYLELLRRGEHMAYYSDGTSEIDFLTRKGREVTALMQVCYDLSNFNTKEREIKPLLKQSEGFSCKNLWVITWDYEAQEMIAGKKIRYIPLWKWLLGEKR